MSTIKYMSILFVCILLLNSSNIVFANTIELSDLKKSFTEKWEQHQKNLPTTILFEKTPEPNIYNYETTLFPYKGKLKLLNVVIDHKNQTYYYGSYDISDNATYIGIAEIELLNAPQGFLDKYNHSSKIFEMQQFLFIKDDNNKWITEEEWKNIDNISNPSVTKSNSNKYCKLKKIGADLIPLLALIIFLICIVLWSRKKQNNYMAKYDLSLKRQEESMDIARKSIQLQTEQVVLLQKLLERK